MIKILKSKFRAHVVANCDTSTDITNLQLDLIETCEGNLTYLNKNLDI